MLQILATTVSKKFDSSGTFLLKFGMPSSENGKFYFPYSIATDSSGNVYVADTATTASKSSCSTGTFLAKWGSNGSADGEFNAPLASPPTPPAMSM
ncbi:MAG: SBBP repeat-containing protein [Candidatus Nomurabacteria bacterium]|nr:MAG: SBBP repeat-containing protein [Candidatus Nomurabacteria bacterium]